MTQVVRWEPFLRDFDTLAGRFNHFFGDFDNPWSLPVRRTLAEPAGTTSFPPVDIYDDGDVLVLEADLPGYAKDDIDVRVANGILQIAGERRPSATGNGPRQYVRRERAIGRFSRSFTLPAMVETGDIEAVFRDGILRVTLPKSEASRPRQIDVRVN